VKPVPQTGAAKKEPVAFTTGSLGKFV